MFTELLDNLCRVPKVRGATIYTDAGQCVEHRLQAPYEESFIGAVMKDLLVSFESFRFLEPASVSLAVGRATDGIMAYMAVNQYRVLAIADPSVNLAFIHVAFSALRQKLSDLESQPLSIPPPESAPPPPQMQVHAQMHTQTQTLMSTQPTTGEFAAVASTTVKRVAAAYTEFAGPAARIVVREEIKSLGYTIANLPLSEVSGLIDRLSIRLGTNEQRQAFAAKLSDLRR